MLLVWFTKLQALFTPHQKRNSKACVLGIYPNLG